MGYLNQFEDRPESSAETPFKELSTVTVKQIIPPKPLHHGKYAISQCEQFSTHDYAFCLVANVIVPMLNDYARCQQITPAFRPGLRSD